MDFLNKPVPQMKKFAGVSLTMPAFLIIMTATILFVITSLMGIFAGRPSVLFVTILAYAVAIYSTYVINCLTVGSCNLLAWILGILYVIMVGLVIIGYVISVFKKGIRATVASYKPPVV
jgi:hypothetical protein